MIISDSIWSMMSWYRFRGPFDSLKPKNTVKFQVSSDQKSTHRHHKISIRIIIIIIIYYILYTIYYILYTIYFILFTIYFFLHTVYIISFQNIPEFERF